MTDPQAFSPVGQRQMRVDPSRLVVLIILSLFGVFFLYQVGGGALTYLVLGDLSVTPENVGLFRTITMVSQIVFILGPALIVAKYSGLRWAFIFPPRIPSLIETSLAVLGLLSLQRVLETLLYLQSLIPVPDIITSLLEPIKDMVKTMMLTLVSSETPLELMAVLLVVAIVPACVEEFFFRGLIQSLIERMSRPIWGVIGSGVIFGLFHLNPFDAVGLVGLGVFLAWTRYRSMTIVLPVLLHFVNNGLAVIAVGAGMNNEELLMESMGQAPSIGLVLAQGALFTALFVAIARLYHRLTERLHRSEESYDV